MAATRAEQLQAVKRAFEQADANKDGFLAAGELASILEQLGMVRGKAERLLQEMDTNRDGRLDVVEFVDWIFGEAGQALDAPNKLWLEKYTGAFRIDMINPIQVTVSINGPGLHFTLDNGPGTPEVAPPVDATESRPGTFHTPWGVFVFSLDGRVMTQNGAVPWTNFGKAPDADPLEDRFIGVYKNLPAQSPVVVVSAAGPGKLGFRLLASEAVENDVAPPIECVRSAARTYVGAWGSFVFSEDGRTTQQNGTVVWVDESKEEVEPSGPREARDTILLPEGGGEDVRWFSTTSMDPEQFEHERVPLDLPPRKVAEALHYEFEQRPQEIVCNRGPVADLGDVVRAPITHYVETPLECPDDVRDWALDMGEKLCLRADELVHLLTSCLKLPEPTLPPGCSCQMNVRHAHICAVMHLNQMKSAIPSENTVYSIAPDELKKKLEAARTDFNSAQVWLRVLLDIGEHPMTIQAGHYIHIMAGMVDLLSRAFAMARVPGDSEAVVTEAPTYENNMSEDELEAWLAQIDCSPQRLSDAARVFCEPLAFMTCNAAHAIRNALRIWGCMVEPNYDGGSGDCNDNGGEAAGGSMGGITGELLKHFAEADGLFGTVEGEMRNLVELLRTSPNAPHSGLALGRAQTVHEQFERARGVFGEAQRHARYMADVGLNAQTLNVYDLIRVQEECFRALGRAIFSGQPAELPEDVLKYSSALAYDRLTPSEAEMVAGIEQRLKACRNFRSSNFYHLTPMEVSGLCRLNCNFGHFIQGLTQRNMLTDGTAAQQYLQEINNHAGNIEAVSRKIMCLVAPEKEQAMWPLTAYLTQVITLFGLIQGIKDKLKLACNHGGLAMTAVPEQAGFGDTGVIEVKRNHITRALDQLDVIARCLVNGMRRTPNTETAKVSKVRPAMLLTSRRSFVLAMDPVVLDQLRTAEKATGGVASNPHLAAFVCHLNTDEAPVTCVHHTIQPGSVFQKEDRGNGHFALFNADSGQYLHATGREGGGWKSDQPVQNPDALQHDFGANLNILMWETELADGSFAYMTFHGNYVTIDSSKDPGATSGLSWDGKPDDFIVVQPDFKPFWPHWKGLETGQFILGDHIVIE